VRLALLGGGQSAVRLGERAVERGRVKTFGGALQLRGQILPRRSHKIGHMLGHPVKTRLHQSPESLGLRLRRLAHIRLDAEGSNALLNRPDRGIRVCFRVGQTLRQPLQAFVQSAHGAAGLRLAKPHRLIKAPHVRLHGVHLALNRLMVFAGRLDAGGARRLYMGVQPLDMAKQGRNLMTQLFLRAL